MKVVLPFKGREAVHAKTFVKAARASREWPGEARISFDLADGR
jgi:hypothetical protein